MSSKMGGFIGGVVGLIALAAASTGCIAEVSHPDETRSAPEALIGDTPTFQYVAAEAALEVGVYVEETSYADVVLVELELSTATDSKTLSLTVPIELADPRPDPIVLEVPWNGKGATGKAMKGVVTVGYDIELGELGSDGKLELVPLVSGTSTFKMP